jgi:hypothetical protein
MRREVLDANDELKFWRFRIEHEGELFHQTIQGRTDDESLDTFVGHLSYIEEGDGESHEIVTVIRQFGEPYFSTVTEAITAADVLILEWRPNTSSTSTDQYEV